MDTPFIFKTPEGHPINIIENAQLVTMEEVQRVAAIREVTDDAYEKENTKWSALFLTNSITQTQRDQLKKHPYAKENGPLLWRALWHLNVSSSLSSTKADIVKLESMRLRDFRGEHVPSCTSRILTRCLQLEKKKALPADINVTVCSILMNCTNQVFSQHFQTLQTRFNLDPSIPPCHAEILSQADNLYNMLRVRTPSTPGWLPTRKVDVSPTAYNTSSNKLTPKSPTSTPRSGSSVTCYNCNKKGHMAKNCPDKDSSEKDQKDIWAAPKKGEPNTRTIRKRELKFCLKCEYKGEKGKWTGHLTKEHEEVMKKREAKAKARKKSREEEATANQATSDDSEENEEEEEEEEKDTSHFASNFAASSIFGVF